MSKRVALQRNDRSMSAPYYPPAPPPVVERKATSWELIQETKIDTAAYPANCNLPLGPLAAPSQCQALLRLPANFTKRSDCEVFELHTTGEIEWTQMDDKALDLFLESRQRSPSSHGDSHVPWGVLPTFRAIFIYLEDVKKTEERASFGCKVSLQQTTAIKLLETFQVNPHFVPFMLGKPDHLAPFSTFIRINDDWHQHEFVCQYPRWYVHTRQEPCTVYLRFDTKSLETTYIVASHRDDEFVSRSKERLKDLMTTHNGNLADVCPRTDPFYFSSILCRESMADSEVVTRKLRLSLYNILDVVDTYADQPFDRVSLRTSTRDLHKISQDCERLLANCEMLSMVVRCMAGAHSKITVPTTVNASVARDRWQISSVTNVADSLAYLAEAVEQQSRWIRGYRRRKDTGMNLVYNLVMQQDSETNTSIAIATKDDSAVMKVIALLTMIFLPLTLVASFFGMSFFTTSAEGEFAAAKNWWVFWAVAVPLTAVTMVVYYIWWQWDILFNKYRQWLRGSSEHRMECDEEKGEKHM